MKLQPRLFKICALGIIHDLGLFISWFRSVLEALLRFVFAVQRERFCPETNDEGEAGEGAAEDPDIAVCIDVGEFELGFGEAVGHGFYDLDEAAGVAGVFCCFGGEEGVCEEFFLHLVLEAARRVRMGHWRL